MFIHIWDNYTNCTTYFHIFINIHKNMQIYVGVMMEQTCSNLKEEIRKIRMEVKEIRLFRGLQIAMS